MKKYLFSPKGPPIGIWSFRSDKYGRRMAKIEKSVGSNKIEVVTICLGKPHVHGEIQIQKLILYLRPNIRQLIVLKSFTDIYFKIPTA